MSVTEDNTKMENQQQPQPTAETSPNAVASTAPVLTGSDDAVKPAAVESLPVKKEDGEAKPAAVMNGTNGSVTVNKETAAVNQETAADGMGDDDEEDAASIKSEGADEEDALFTKLEQEEEAEEAAHPHAQPSDAAAAPTLLKNALEKGDVKMDESEHGATETNEEEHVHKRENQLEFLLAKASEFSSFISNDLQELQAAMTAKAQEKEEKSDKRKKRKGGSSSKAPAKKKGKGNSGEALKTALIKDEVSRSGSKPIFIQPANLAPGCYLKDYQLEGMT